MGLTSSLALVSAVTFVKQQDLAVGTVPLSKTYRADLVDGAAAGQANLTFQDTRTIAPSANEDLDLAGVLLDPFGTALTFARIKMLVISAALANSNNVVVGAAAANPWITLLNSTGTITLRPGAAMAFVAGQTDATAWTVTAGTGDLLRVANSGAGTSVNYDIIIVGA